MVRTEKVAVDRLEYRWQDRLPDLLISRMHESYLHSPSDEFSDGYRTGLRASGARGQALVDLFLDIRLNGIKEPCRVGPGPNAGQYRMILGNQRLAIARALGIDELECEIYGP